MATVAVPAAALGPLIYARGFRFSPTPQEAVTYYLPRLVSGDPAALHEIVRPVIHRADVYASGPADLARRFRPMPRTHNRFFFTAVKKGVRAAGSGSWAGQSTTGIKDKKEVQIGELRKFRYKKRGGEFTDWLMEEYSSCGPNGAVAGGDVQPVLCKVYVSPKAAPNSDAYKESATCFATPPPAVPAIVITQQPAAAKRPAMSSQCAKRMRVSAVQPAPPPQPPAPPAPTLSSFTAAVQCRCSTTPPATQPSLPSVRPLAPPAPTRPPLAAVRKMPPQPCLTRRGLTIPSATRSSPASAPAPAPPPPTRPAMQPRGSPMPLPPPPRPPAQPKQQVSLPTTTPPVASTSHMPQQVQLPKQTVAAAAAPAMLQDDGGDDDDDFAKEIDDMLSADADEENVAAARTALQDDDEFAKVVDDMMSADAEEPALEFDFDGFFNSSEKDLELEASMPACHQGLILA